SKAFQNLPIKNFRLARLAWIQLFKRSPVNLRTIFQVDKEYNSKGLGLFLSGYCNLYLTDPQESYKQKIFFLANELEHLHSKGFAGMCWGYNFDWQARAFFQPKQTPTVVATTYVAYSLLDAYDIFKEERWLMQARSSCDFVLENLNRTYDNDGDFCFSYSPLDKTQVFNASLLGSRLLSRVYSYTKDEKLLEAARKSISFCCKMQQENGAWSYGTLPFHQWIDNFHTGFNLECIHEFQKFTGDTSFEKCIERGLNYYLTNFFTEKGESKYYNNSLYPVDIHSPAQLIITLGRMGLLKVNQPLLDRVIAWTVDNMQDPKGYFYYQIKSVINSRIPYMRWAQSWMFFSFSYYIRNLQNQND
ncbi:MAG: delta-aminolevulinic acid dehydratase, partial [Bacteroidia bacterium]|nr:delta-aminolevulinic acid dehydratase [Bacteroidia bacterium]